MDLTCLIGKLKTHEIERKAREEMAPKMTAFKSTPSDDDDEEEDDEELYLLVKNIRRTYNKAKFNNRRRWQGKEDKKIICFNCCCSRFEVHEGNPSLLNHVQVMKPKLTRIFLVKCVVASIGSNLQRLDFFLNLIFILF